MDILINKIDKLIEKISNGKYESFLWKYILCQKCKYKGKRVRRVALNQNEVGWYYNGWFLNEKENSIHYAPHLIFEENK